MEGYLKKQFVAQNRFTASVANVRGDALYAGCAQQTSSTGTHALTLVREHASQSKGPCWTGYHRDYSKAEGTNDSCVKNGTSNKKKKKKKRKKKTKSDESSSSSSSSEDEDGKPKKKAKKEEK
tara:strand:- start:2875 stop:3243 length:369 start_codon:yes stop_codon:yes gene_type:complete